MKCYLKKSVVAVLAAVFLMSAVGCEKKTEYSDIIDEYGSIAEEDLPYGSTIVQLKPSTNENVKMSIEYDRRFLTEEEVIKVSDYMQALNDCDTSLMESTVYPDYLTYLKEVNSVESTETYLTVMHDGIKTSYTDGSDFEFNYILVNSCLDETSSDDETGFSILDSILDSYAKKSGQDDVSSKITSRKLVGIDTMYTLASDGGSYSLTNRTGSDQQIYIYTIDGQIYIL